MSESTVATRLAVTASDPADYERFGLAPNSIARGRTAHAPTTQPVRTSGGTSTRVSLTAPSSSWCS
jgi:hypothetical protein